MTCLRRRLRGGKRKGAGGIGDFFSQRDGQQGREGGSGAESTWKRETDRERGLVWRSAAGTDTWLTGVGGQRARLARRATGAKTGDGGG
jgi:hypothetical protein